MDEDEWYAAKKAKANITLPRALDRLSLEELDDYVTLLEEEKKRVAAEKNRRRNVLGAAEALFKKSD
jgi:uncharacterized small protein (DUF1192 family)